MDIELVTAEQPPAESSGIPASAPRRMVDHLNPWVVNLLTVFGFAVPVIGYFWMVITYGVDVVWYDQWSNVQLLQQTWNHPFDISAYWVPHNENRELIPNLLVGVLAHTVHFDIKVEELLGAVLLLAATAIVLRTHKRRSTTVPWLYYCPVMFVAFSLVQHGNSLWGVQIELYLALIFIVTAIFLLDRDNINWIVLAGAIAAGFAGTYSSLQGALIWPVGLFLLYHRRRRWRDAIVWIVSAFASIAIFYYHFGHGVGGPFPDFSRNHPFLALKFLLFLIGDVVGATPHRHGSGNAAIIFCGLVIVVLAVGSILAYGIRRDEKSASPVGIAITLVGLGTAVLTMQGRAYFGYAGASDSRYTTFDLLILVGTFLTFLGRPRLEGVGKSTADRQSFGARIRAWTDRVGAPAALGIVIVVILVQVVLGTSNGLRDSKHRYRQETQAARVLLHFRARHDAVARDILDPFERYSTLAREVRFLEQHNLTVFAGRHATLVEQSCNPHPERGQEDRALHCS